MFPMRTGLDGHMQNPLQWRAMEKSVQTFLECFGFAVLCLDTGLHWEAEKTCVGSIGLGRMMGSPWRGASI